MNSSAVRKLVLLALVIFLASCEPDLKAQYSCKSSSKPCLIYDFSFVNISFPFHCEYEDYIAEEKYKLAIFSGIKLSHKGRLFVSMPRWFLNRYGDCLPATLFEIEQGQPTHNPLLKPYPTMELNRRLSAFEAYFSSAL